VSVFVDTSAVYALLDAGDSNHERALRATESLLGEELVTHSYVVVELVSLVRRRLGAAAAARLIDDVLPALEIADVDASLRYRALAAFRAATPSDVSLVDRTSFEFMRQRGIRRAWAMDSDFEAEGFQLEA
jgi:predicted nucleic acid-binding protein